MPTVVVMITGLGLALHQVVEMLKAMLDPKHRAPGWTWNLVAFALGIGAALIWELSLLPNRTNLQAIGGRILTGLALGGAAGGFNQAVGALKAIGAASAGSRTHASD